MIIIVIAVLTITTIYLLKGIYINKFDLKGSLRVLKLSFKSTEKKRKKSCTYLRYSSLLCTLPHLYSRLILSLEYILIVQTDLLSSSLQYLELDSYYLSSNNVPFLLPLLMSSHGIYLPTF